MFLVTNKNIFRITNLQRLNSRQFSGEKAKEITDEFYEPEGEISSPDFPNNYPENHLITYRIFTDNYIEVSFSCDFIAFRAF